jgi:hypothetical protein
VPVAGNDKGASGAAASGRSAAPRLARDW